MEAYLGSVSDVLSYALMRNHFHIALRIKAENETGWLRTANADSEDPFVKWSTSLDPPTDANRKKPEIQFMLRHLLGAYSKWFNVRYHRSGKLFEERHERKIVNSEDHLRQLILYINRNPEKHKVTKAFYEYEWISYHTLISDSPTWLSRPTVFELFQDKETFMAAMKRVDFDDWLKELEYEPR